MDKIYRVDLVEIGDGVEEPLEALLNERVEEGYILDKVFSFALPSRKEGYEAILVVTIKPPEPELNFMTPEGQIPIIG